MRNLSLVGPTYPSASALSQAAICVAPWSLGLTREDAAGPDAERGKRCHKGSEALANGASLAAALDGTTATFSQREEAHFVLLHVEMALSNDRAKAVEIQWSDGQRRKLRAEVGVQWRPLDLGDEGRLVQREPGEESVGWFSGSADLAYVRADGVLVVVDWKFGARQRYVSERARDHWQGWSLALYLCSALGISAARPGDVVARFEARYVDEEGVWADGISITQGELDAHAVRLAEMARRIESGEGPAVGAACGSCKARVACPAREQVAGNAAALVANTEPHLMRPPQTPDEARRLHIVLGAVEDWVARARDWRRAYVLTHPPIPLGVGQELRAVESQKRAVVRTPEALAIVEEVAGVAAVETVTTRKATVASIREAARAVGDDVKSASDRKKLKDAAEERVFGELVARGAVVEKGARYAIGVRRSTGEVELVDKFSEEGE